MSYADASVGGDHRQDMLALTDGSKDCDITCFCLFQHVPHLTSGHLHQDTPIVTYCAAGVRAQSAVDMLIQEEGHCKPEGIEDVSTEGFFFGLFGMSRAY